MDNNVQFDTQDIEKSKSLVWLSYLGILFLIPMLANKDSAYTRFHVNQGLVLFLSELVLSIVLNVLSVILTMAVPVLGIIISLLSGLIYLALFIFAIMGIVNSLQGKAKQLPIIGKIQILK